MPNITPVVADPFIPEIWANIALDYLRPQLVMARLIARDTDVAAFSVGDVLHIPYPGTFTAQDKAPGANVSPQTPSGIGSVTVQLNKHKEVTFLIEDITRAFANQDLVDRYMRAAAIALAEAIERDLLALHADVTQTVGTAGSNLTADVIRQARKSLNDAKAPFTDRVFVISTKDEVALLADADLKEYFAYSRPQAITDANLGRAYGFDIWTSQLVPVIAGTPNETRNLAFQRDAFMLVMRGLPEPPAGSGARAATVRDPESGIVLRAITTYNAQALGVQVTLDVLYGVKTIRPELAVIARA